MGDGRAGWQATAAVVALACLLVQAPLAPVLAAVRIGGTESVVNEVNAFLGEVTRVLDVPDEIFSEEVIETSPEGATKVVFNDGSELVMGPNSRVTLDRYVFDPDAGDGSLTVSLVSGIFEFASGLIPSDGYDIRTPFANLAIRGTVLRVLITPTGLQVTAPQGIITARDASGRVIELDSASNCIIWGVDFANLGRLEECGSLISAFITTAGLLGLPEPAAALAVPPLADPAQLLTVPPGFDQVTREPPVSVSPSGGQSIR